MKTLIVLFILLFSPSALAIGLSGSGNGLSQTQVFQVSKGTFICTSGGTITVGNANMQASSLVIISLNTAGGTISTDPTVKTISTGVNFTALCATSDTSIYNYAILN